MAKEEQSRLAAAVSKARGDIRSEDDMRNSINFLNDAANRIKDHNTPDKLARCPLDHLAVAGLKVNREEPRITCLDCELTITAPDWNELCERWHSRRRRAAASSPAPAEPPTDEQLCAVAERVNAGVAQMNKSQKVDAATMQIEINPAATPPANPSDAAMRAAVPVVAREDVLAVIENYKSELKNDGRYDAHYSARILTLDTLATRLKSIAAAATSPERECEIFDAGFATTADNEGDSQRTSIHRKDCGMPDCFICYGSKR